MHARFFASAPKGLEPLLADELTALGAASVRPIRAGVSFEGPLELAYRACLWSRIANRILLPLETFPAADANELYESVRAIDWSAHVSVDGTIAVDFTTSQSPLAHTQFGAQRVKDAIVDQFRDRCQRRPSVDRLRPDLRVNVHARRTEATISLDLSGDSLHRRGYRAQQTAAPLKENVAAAVLMRAGWAAIAAAGGAFVDPMCGSGTFPIEAALIAGDVAPALGRAYFGFLGWRSHQPKTWAVLVDEARQRAAARRRIPPVVGYDRDRHAVAIALANVERAGLRGRVHIERRDVTQSAPPPGSRPGLLTTNPPYGERLGDRDAAGEAYAQLGATLAARFGGWTACVLAGNQALGRRIGLRAHRRHTVFNGALACDLLTFAVPEVKEGIEL